MRLRPQPARHIHRQDDPSVRRPRQRHRHQRGTQPLHTHPASGQRVVQGAVPPTVLGNQRQRRQRTHRPVRAQHRIGELEQRLTTAVKDW
jgi:hypothetical protein